MAITDTLFLHSAIAQLPSFETVCYCSAIPSVPSRSATERRSATRRDARPSPTSNSIANPSSDPARRPAAAVDGFLVSFEWPGTPFHVGPWWTDGSETLTFQPRVCRHEMKYCEQVRLEPSFRSPFVTHSVSQTKSAWSTVLRTSGFARGKLQLQPEWRPKEQQKFRPSRWRRRR